MQIDFEPLGIRSQGNSSTSLQESARQAGIVINALCGGLGKCGSCKIQVLDGPASAHTEAEQTLLTPDELSNGYRLACQVYPLGDIKIHIPVESLTATQRIQLESQESVVTIDPIVRNYDAFLPMPTLHDTRSDVTRLTDYLEERYGLENLSIDFELLKSVPTCLRELDWATTIGIREGEIVSLKPLGKPSLGLAVDLGTTKIAAYLVDLREGRTLASSGITNPQIAYGEDVISRIAYAMKGAKEATILSEVVITSLNELAHRLCSQSDCNVHQIEEVVIAGNTVMRHLILMLPVAQLGLAPYISADNNPLDVKAKALNLDFSPGCYIHFPPNIGGFIGSDCVAMILATSINQAKNVVLGMDIGTNTEITLKTPQQIYACSTASGPAFEGAHIRNGMRAADGAIEKVRIVGSVVEYQTIGGVAPIGLCGSGILDVVAQLFRLGIINEAGTMKDNPLVRRGKDGPEFVLVGKSAGNNKEIVITRRDIGEIQLAKGAIQAGINILLAEAGLKETDIDQVIIAGAFGSYINVDSAIAIGILPRLPPQCFNQVGNAAGMGAKIILVSNEKREQAKKIPNQVHYVDLITNSNFFQEFSKAMFLPKDITVSPNQR